MCICVRLQDPDEKPTKADPKYFEKARVALLKKVESGQVVTRRMLQQEVQKFYRQAYKAWHKRVRAKKVSANDDMALLLTDLGYGALNIDTWSSPLENSCSPTNCSKSSSAAFTPAATRFCDCGAPAGACGCF